MSEQLKGKVGELRSKIGEIAEELKGKISKSLERSLWNVSDLARHLDSLQMMRSSVKFEKEAKGDNQSPLPALMDEAVAFIGQVLTAMIAEEVNALTGKAPEGGEASAATAQTAEALAAAAKPGDIQRVGARFSRSTSGTLREVVRKLSGLLGLRQRTDDEMDAEVKEVADAEKKAADDESQAAKDAKAEDQANKDKEAEAAARTEKTDPPKESPEIQELRKELETARSELSDLKRKFEEATKKPADAKTHAGGTGNKPGDNGADRLSNESDIQRAIREAQEKKDTEALLRLSLKGYDVRVPNERRL